MKISSLAIYRFYRNGLPAMTQAALVCVVLFGILAFAIFSPGFAFEQNSASERSQVAVLGISENYVETGVFQDSEPLFLPTRWNFGAADAPKELSLSEQALLPFREMLFLGASETGLALDLQISQTPAAAENALGNDAWNIARGFGAGTLSFVSGGENGAAVPAKTRIRVENADSGETVFSGVLEGLSGDAQEMLLAPAEFLCGIASGYGLPRVVIVSSCGDIDRDRQIEKSASALLSSLNLGRGVYRIFVDLR